MIYLMARKLLLSLPSCTMCAGRLCDVGLGTVARASHIEAQVVDLGVDGYDVMYVIDRSHPLAGEWEETGYVSELSPEHIAALFF